MSDAQVLARPSVLMRPSSAAGVEVVTFGCRLNACESEQARARAIQDGLTDAVIFNTCAVTGEAVRQARQAIRRARRERPGARLVVTGCAAQIEPEAFAAMPEVDAVVGQARKSAPGAYALDAPRVSLGHLDAAREVAPHLFDGQDTGVLADRARAYVEVQNGCDHRCTFCVIPLGRGPSRSVPAGEVVERVRRLARAGYPEVVLTGVDVTAWGADLPGRPTLGGLVTRILRLAPDLPRLRLSSIDAAEIDAELLRAFAEAPRLMPHLHLSLQSGDDLVLKQMKRRHSCAQALDLIAQVRRVRPDVAVGADLIAGFPTETEAAFARTLAFVDEAALAYLHVFPFSPRPGTPAARMPALERSVVKARAERLRDAGRRALVRHLDAQVGRTVSVVVERAGLGRAEDFTEVAFTGEAQAAQARAGDVIALRVTGHDGRRAAASLLRASTSSA